MSEKLVCRLKLTVTGVLVDGKLTWREEIWTEGVRRHMAPGVDLREYERELCAQGRLALEEYGQQVEAERQARQKAEKS